MPSKELQKALLPIQQRWYRTEDQLIQLIKDAYAALPQETPPPEPKAKKTRKKKSESEEVAATE